MIRRGLFVLLPILVAIGLFAIGRAAPMGQASAQSVVFPVVVTVLKAANVRAGPGTEFAIVSGASAGEHLNVIGCNGDCSWYQLAEDCWIAAFLVQPEQPIAAPLLTPLISLAIPVSTTPAAPSIGAMPTIVLSIPITTGQGAPVQSTHCPQTVAPTTTYGGPGEIYPIVDIRPQGECVSVIGRDITGEWYQLAHGAWIHSVALIYTDPIENIPVTDQPYTPTPVLPPTPFITATLVVVATPVPTVTVDVAEIMTVGEWMVASQESKEATSAIWTQRYLNEGKVSYDQAAFAADLLDCVDNTLAGTAEILGESYPAQSVADGCQLTLQ